MAPWVESQHTSRSDGPLLCLLNQLPWPSWIFPRFSTFRCSFGDCSFGGLKRPTTFVFFLVQGSLNPKAAAAPRDFFVKFHEIIGCLWIHRWLVVVFFVCFFCALFSPYLLLEFSKDLKKTSKKKATQMLRWRSRQCRFVPIRHLSETIRHRRYRHGCKYCVSGFGGLWIQGQIYTPED